jgi:hypothetical protein
MPENQIQQGTAGRLGILKQSAFNTIQATDSSFYYVAFTGCDFGPQEQSGALPQEAGNTKALTRGVFKAGVMAAGTVAFIPRLDNRFGYWLEAVCGDASSYADQTIAQVIAGSGSEAGVNTHLFGFVDGDDFDLPYLTVHRLLPHDTAASQVGEIMQDVRVAQWTLNVPAAAIVTNQMAMLGRCNTATVWDLNPGWSSPTLDDDDTFLVTACTGSVSFSVTGGTPAALTAFDVSGARITWSNNLLPPNQTRRVGSPHPKDFPCLSRSITIETTIFMEDYDLYVQTFGGPAAPVTDTGWLCTPLAGDFDITLQSPEVIGATTEYHQLRIRTLDGNVRWLCRPVVLAPNRVVMLQLQGTVIPGTTNRDIYVWMQNNHTNYD